MWQRSCGCGAELLLFAVRAMGSSLGMDTDGSFYVDINSSLVLSTQREVPGYPCIASAATTPPNNEASSYFHLISRTFVSRGSPLPPSLVTLPGSWQQTGNSEPGSAGVPTAVSCGLLVPSVTLLHHSSAPPPAPQRRCQEQSRRAWLREFYTRRWDQSPGWFLVRPHAGKLTGFEI